MKPEDTAIFNKLNDSEAAILTIWGEARGESFLGKQMVAQIIANRAVAWDKTVKEICYQRNQFSCYISTDPNYTKLLEIAKDFEGAIKVIVSLSWCKKAWELNRNEVAKQLQGAEYYRVHGTNEAWFTTQVKTGRFKKVAEERHHEFFKDIKAPVQAQPAGVV